MLISGYKAVVFGNHRFVCIVHRLTSESYSYTVIIIIIKINSVKAEVTKVENSDENGMIEGVVRCYNTYRKE